MNGEAGQARNIPWLKWLMAFTFACTPGGFMFLIALVTESNINMPLFAWFLFAALAGVGGFFMGRRIGG